MMHSTEEFSIAASAEQQSARQCGYIRMASRRGYGFIRTDDGQEYFVHVRDVSGLANSDMAWKKAIGKLVEFTPVPIASEDKSPRAVRVQVLS